MRPHDHIRQPTLAEFLLEDPRLFVGPEQDRHIVRLDVQLGDLIGHIRRDKLRLFLLIGEAAHPHRVGRLLMCHQLLVVAILIVFYQPVGQLQDGLGATVVVLQSDDFRPREHLVKAQDVLHFGSAPTVDRLVVITDDAQVFMRANQRFNQAELNAVGVLIFVNLHIQKSLLPPSQNFREFVEQLHRQ